MPEFGRKIAGVDGAIKSEAVEVRVGEAAEQVLFLLLGLLGLITATSPKSICTLKVWPSARTSSANAAYLLRVAIGAKMAATGSFLVEIANEDRLRVCCVRLFTPPVSD